MPNSQRFFEVPDSYEDIVEACCDAWNQFMHIPGAIRLLCTRSWTCLTPEPKSK